MRSQIKILSSNSHVLSLLVPFNMNTYFRGIVKKSLILYVNFWNLGSNAFVLAVTIKNNNNSNNNNNSSSLCLKWVACINRASAQCFKTGPTIIENGMLFKMIQLQNKRIIKTMIYNIIKA